MLISSLQNPRIKNLGRLRDRRHRDRQQKLLIEGYRAIRRALDNNVPVEELYVCAELFLGENENSLCEAAAARGAVLVELSPAVFRKIAYRDRPEGLLAVAPQFHRSLAELEVPPRALFIAVQGIEKPGNLGAMLRSADAAGADAVIVCDACTDIFNPNVVCASVGTLFSLPVAEAASAEAIEWCGVNGVTIAAATPEAGTVYTEADLTGKTMLVMGTEQYGLTELWLKAAELKVRIPMYGQADSLNVAGAAALLLFEAVRQRRAAGILS